ncbi:hypothetical protein Mtc_2159 [Methanocella conradii HZ254]|uniref:Uncharacterized protein n=1 Tax=Methanocella conradii (strain DSM 24694 / JCM 17849 / CGMCC 1.5162 / HZ254) TaxID=1041930 RepID=H8I879_METCZ|nr:ACT domain-containing protein [Methanocella conradii]AFD00897.1 hypothetical protein Mtc_2159 [Methanocella conradii HZ254]
MKLSLLKGKFAVCRLEKSAPIPEWLKESTFFTVSRTYDELSFVCSQESIPEYIECDKDWRCLQVEGPLPFNETGILASLTAPLANAKIPIFVFSTYDTDYVMVKDGDLDKAVRTLSAERHSVRR